MNNTKKIAFAAAMLCSAGTTLAQEINPSWYIQPSVVGVKPDRDFGVDDRDWGGGLKFGKPVSQMWDIQFGATHVRAEDGANHYHQTLLGADALLMLSRKNFRPFVLVGVGAQRDKVENPLRNVSATSPYVTAGLGFQLGLSDQWAMQADLRTVRGRLDDEAVRLHSQQQQIPDGRLQLRLQQAGAAHAAPPPPPPPPVAEQPAPPPPPPPPPPPARFEKVTLSATELFAFNSATLSMPQPRLDDIAAALPADPSITDVDITGYADRLGSDEVQPEAVGAARQCGARLPGRERHRRQRLKAYGKGEANPVVTCNNKKRAELIKCLEPNRRVEVEQITVEQPRAVSDIADRRCN